MGQVWIVPELKLVTMKSSNDKAKPIVKAASTPELDHRQRGCDGRCPSSL
jgi:hypothetical protein